MDLPDPMTRPRCSASRDHPAAQRCAEAGPAPRSGGSPRDPGGIKVSRGESRKKNMGLPGL